MDLRELLIPLVPHVHSYNLVMADSNSFVGIDGILSSLLDKNKIDGISLRGLISRIASKKKLCRRMKQVILYNTRKPN